MQLEYYILQLILNYNLKIENYFLIIILIKEKTSENNLFYYNFNFKHVYKKLSTNSRIFFKTVVNT